MRKFNNNENTESFPIIEGLADYIGEEQSSSTSTTVSNNSVDTPLLKQQVIVHQQHEYQNPIPDSQQQLVRGGSSAAIGSPHDLFRRSQSQTVHQVRVSSLHQQQYPTVINTGLTPTAGGNVIARHISMGGNFQPINRGSTTVVSGNSTAGFQQIPLIQTKRMNVVSGQIQSHYNQRRIVRPR